GAGLPADDARHGMVYRGLELARTGGCAGLLRVAGTGQCTHGPDRVWPGMDVARPVGAAPTAAAAASTVVCDGDGQTGNRVQVLYVHGTTDRYAQFLASFRTWAQGGDDIYNARAAEPRGGRHVRPVT